MRTMRQVSLVIALLTTLLPAVALAQNAPPPPPPPPAAPAPPVAPAAAPRPMPSPVKLDIVISRYDGERLTSRMPFTLWPTPSIPPNNATRAQIRTGLDVPVGTINENRTSTPQGSGTPTNTSTTRQEYRSIGTNIDCGVTLRDGRYAVYVFLTDTSLYDPTVDRVATLAQRGLATNADVLKSIGAAAFRTLTVLNEVNMNDGQTAQFALATDKVTGETIKVDVTISAVK